MQNVEQTEMQATTQKQTRMSAPAPKLVTIEALQTIYVNGEYVHTGEKVQVDEKMAEQFCRPIKGFADHSGEMSLKRLSFHEQVRAKRVA